MSEEIGLNSFGIANFTKHTKLKDLEAKNVSPVIIFQFKAIDKNHDGKLNSTEFNLYKQITNLYRQFTKRTSCADIEGADNQNQEVQDNFTSINNEDIQKYDAKITELLTNIGELNQQYSNLYSECDYWEEMIKFEHEHSISRDGLNDNQELPEGAVEMDVEWCQMGVQDAKGENFTGDICKKGYILFPEGISSEDKEKYLELFNKASIQCKQAVEISSKISEISDEYQNALAIKDLLQNGIVAEVKNEEQEQHAIALYQEIRAISNPYYQLYKEAEEKYNSLARKVNLTAEELVQLSTYLLEMRQYKETSDNWSVANIRETENKQTGSFINIAGEKVTFTKDDSKKTMSCTTGLSLGGQFGNFQGNGNITITNTTIIKPIVNGNTGALTTEVDNNNSVQANGGISYNSNNIGASTAIHYNNDGTTENIEAEGQVQYKNTTVNAKHTVTKINSDNQEDTQEANEQTELSDKPITSTSVNVSYPIGKFVNTAEFRTGAEGTSYSYSLTANDWRLLNKNNLKLNIAPAFDYTFNNSTFFHTTNTGINGQLTIGQANGENNERERGQAEGTQQDNPSESSSNKTAFTVNTGYSLNSVMRHGFRPQQTKTFIAGATVRKGLLGLGINISNTDNTSSNSWTYGGNISFGAAERTGVLSVEVSEQRTKQKPQHGIETSNSVTKNLQASISYCVPLSTIGGWLGFKPKHSPIDTPHVEQSQWQDNYKNYQDKKAKGDAPKTDIEMRERQQYISGLVQQFFSDSKFDFSDLNNTDIEELSSAVKNTNKYEEYIESISMNEKSQNTEFKTTIQSLYDFKDWLELNGICI